MKKSNMDLIVGGSILLALLILVSGVLWLKDVSVTRNVMQYTVHFPEIGVLQPGDAVMVNGVKMGSVLSESLLSDQVKVVINLDKSVTLTDSCEVRVQNIGLMGERAIGVRLSTAGRVIAPNKKGKTETVITGHFDTGIAEAIGMVGTVLGDVQVLVKNVDGIVKSTVGDTSFAPFFRRVVNRLDTVTLLVDRLVRNNEKNITASVTEIRQITTDIDRLLKENQASINTIVANGSDLSTRAVRIAAQVETLSVSLRSITGSIERGEGSVGRLMKDEQFYTDLKRTVGQLDTLITDVNNRGLKLRIKLGYRENKKSN